jgi:nuclear transport factor 2 (NTF2) superfamily protein
MVSSNARQGTAAMELSFAEAKTIVQNVENLFGRADLPKIIEGFTADAVARFADFPEMRGREAIGKFLAARFARQRDYRLTKHLRMVMGDMIGNEWQADWTDGKTAKTMRGRGMEFWTMRDGKIAVWDATFNVWEEGGPPSTPVV